MNEWWMHEWMNEWNLMLSCAKIAYGWSVAVTKIIKHKNEKYYLNYMNKNIKRSAQYLLCYSYAVCVWVGHTYVNHIGQLETPTAFEYPNFFRRIKFRRLIRLSAPTEGGGRYRVYLCDAWRQSSVAADHNVVMRHLHLPDRIKDGLPVLASQERRRQCGIWTQPAVSGSYRLQSESVQVNK